LSPDPDCDFEIHVADMLNLNTLGKYYVVQQMAKIEAFHPVCVFGNQEDTQIVNKFKSTGVPVQLLNGNHHYNNEAKAVSTIIRTLVSQ